MIKSEPIWISVSKDGYIKRSTPKSHKSSKQIKLNIQDALIAEFNTNTFANLVLFFDNATFTSIPAHELKSTKWSDKGQHISGLITIPAEVNLIQCFIQNATDEYNIILGSKLGMVKKTPISKFVTKRWKTPSMAMKLKNSDQLLDAYQEYGNSFVSFISQSGFANKYLAKEISLSSTKSTGVKGNQINKWNCIWFCGFWRKRKSCFYY